MANKKHIAQADEFTLWRGSLGSKVRRIRSLKKMDPTTVAVKLNLGLKAYENMENSGEGLTLEAMYELSRIFGIKIGDLFTFPDDISLPSTFAGWPHRTR